MIVPEFFKSKDGLIFGTDEQDNFLRSDGYQHVLLMAPTGAGKGVSFVIPNLLSWNESAIVHDVKLENFLLTSGHREKQGQKIYIFDPLNEENKTHRYNPFDFVNSKLDLMYNDIHKMAALLMPDNDFWHYGARTLFIGLGLYLKSSKKSTCSLGEIYRMSATNLVSELKKIVKKLKAGSKVHEIISNFLTHDPKEQSGIIATLAAHLELFSNPFIDYATSASDFDFKKFRTEKSTLYVGVRASDINRLKPLMQFFYQHIMQNFSENPVDTKKEPYGILMLLDEFSTLGKLNYLTTAVAYLRGFKVKLALIAQNLNDIESTYCERGTNKILSNCTFKIAYTPNNIETANFILSYYPGKKLADIMTVPTMKQQIILVEYNEPLTVKKFAYYDRKDFKDKIIPEAKLKFKKGK